MGPENRRHPQILRTRQKLKAEHGRHGEAVGKAIDEFSEKCLKGEKTEGHLGKAIEESVSR